MDDRNEEYQNRARPRFNDLDRSMEWPQQFGEVIQAAPNNRVEIRYLFENLRQNPGRDRGVVDVNLIRPYGVLRPHIELTRFNQRQIIEAILDFDGAEQWVYQPMTKRITYKNRAQGAADTAKFRYFLTTLWEECLRRRWKLPVR
ncbi:hypothetical protein U1Q18_051718, partial [Sarracenia purpurea var. burkii]